MIILGVDPGSQRTGYGLVVRRGTRLELVDAGVIDARREDDLPDRVRLIYERLGAVIARHRPAEMALEGLFTARNARSALVLGHARGVIMLAGAQAGLTVTEYAPRKVKSALTGNGAASKEQLRFMVTRLLNLKRAPDSLDTSDALAVALCHALQGPGAALTRIARS